MTDQKYILDDGHNLVPVDLLTWAKWFGEAERHVGSTRVGKKWVSTVFLGIDHNFGLRGPPLLFETMVFEDIENPSRFNKGEGWSDGGETWRYATWDEAAAGHEKIVARLKKEEEA